MQLASQDLYWLSVMTPHRVRPDLPEAIVGFACGQAGHPGGKGAEHHVDCGGPGTGDGHSPKRSRISTGGERQASGRRGLTSAGQRHREIPDRAGAVASGVLTEAVSAVGAGLKPAVICRLAWALTSELSTSASRFEELGVRLPSWLRRWEIVTHILSDEAVMCLCRGRSS